MKEFYCTAGSRSNPVHARVQLNNVAESVELTPTLAKRAARVAFGHALGVTVADGKKAYRLTRSGARKIADSR